VLIASNKPVQDYRYVVQAPVQVYTGDYICYLCWNM